jgi:TPR repeat protein
MVDLGMLLLKRGEDDEAEDWFRKATQKGHPDAKDKIAALLRKQGKDIEDQ